MYKAKDKIEPETLTTFNFIEEMPKTTDDCYELSDKIKEVVNETNKQDIKNRIEKLMLTCDLCMNYLK